MSSARVQTLILTASLVLLLTGARATATSITLYAVQDAELMKNGAGGVVKDMCFGSSSALTMNWGLSTEPTANKFPQGADSFGLFQFDLTGVPVGAVINSAKVSLYAVTIDRWNSTLGAVSLFQVNSTWNESTVTFATAPTQDSVAIASLEYSDNALGYRSADLTSLTQAWLDGTTANFGLITSDVNQSLDRARAYIRYASSEADLTQRPRLEIDFTAPTTVPDGAASIWLVAFGLLGLAGFRRLRNCADATR